MRPHPNATIGIAHHRTTYPRTIPARMAVGITSPRMPDMERLRQPALRESCRGLDRDRCQRGRRNSSQIAAIVNWRRSAAARERRPRPRVARAATNRRATTTTCPRARRLRRSTQHPERNHDASNAPRFRALPLRQHSLREPVELQSVGAGGLDREKCICGQFHENGERRARTLPKPNAATEHPELSSISESRWAQD